MEIKNNIFNTALIFEGGGMRASFSSGILNVLLENHLYFDYVAGISAGSSCLVNYLSRDTKRAYDSFVTLAGNPNFGGWNTFIKGEGFFNAQWIYEETAGYDQPLPFNREIFDKNPAKLRIGAFQRETGQMTYWQKSDIHSVKDLMKMVQSSSALPGFMPAVEYDNIYYVDGGLSGGIPLDIAKQDGYQKFFIVRTREKNYRRNAPTDVSKLFYRPLKKYPYAYEALLTRYIHYNDTLDEISQLEKEGKAYVVYPQHMLVSNRERDVDLLNKNYELGYEQGWRDIENWKRFLRRD